MIEIEGHKIQTKVTLPYRQDTILTLEALTKYSAMTKDANLNMGIKAAYRTKGDLDFIMLTESRPVGKRITVRGTMTIYPEVVSSINYMHYTISSSNVLNVCVKLTPILSIQVSKNDDIILSTGLSTGVSVANVSVRHINWNDSQILRRLSKHDY